MVGLTTVDYSPFMSTVVSPSNLLSYLNHPEELIVEEVCHVAITTDIGMNTVAT